MKWILYTIFTHNTHSNHIFLMHYHNWLNTKTTGTNNEHNTTVTKSARNIFHILYMHFLCPQKSCMFIDKCYSAHQKHCTRRKPFALHQKGRRKQKKIEENYQNNRKHVTRRVSRQPDHPKTDRKIGEMLCKKKDNTQNALTQRSITQ